MRLRCWAAALASLAVGLAHAAPVRYELPTPGVV